jgi:hypothetical protein
LEAAGQLFFGPFLFGCDVAFLGHGA